MPITQHRMIALVNAAREYQRSFDAFAESVRGSCQRARQPGQTLESLRDEFANLALMANAAAWLQDPIEVATTIAAEYSHFKATSARNNYEAMRQARQRGKLPTRQTRPQTPARLPQQALNDPRISAEDAERFAAQQIEDAKRDKGFSLDFVLDPQTQAEIEAEAARELERQEHEAKAEAASAPAKGE